MSNLEHPDAEELGNLVLADMAVPQHVKLVGYDQCYRTLDEALEVVRNIVNGHDCVIIGLTTDLLSITRHTVVGYAIGQRKKS